MEEYTLSKRDKRRGNIAARLRSLNETFDSERDTNYNKMLMSLQTSLCDLHNANDPEFLDLLEDLEEERDNRLTELALWEKYQLEQAHSQHKEDVESAMATYDHMMLLVKEKLRARLETQRRQLSEDRSLLDISNDHSFFLQAANPGAPPNRNLTAPGGLASLSSAERRSLRRRGRNADDLTAEDLSGISGSESAPTRRTRSTASRGQHSSGPDSDAGTTSAAAGADSLDSVLKDFDRPQQRHITKSYQGVKALKNDEGLADLALITEADRRLRRSQGY